MTRLSVTITSKARRVGDMADGGSVDGGVVDAHVEYSSPPRRRCGATCVRRVDRTLCLWTSQVYLREAAASKAAHDALGTVGGVNPLTSVAFRAGYRRARPRRCRSRGPQYFAYPRRVDVAEVSQRPEPHPRGGGTLQVHVVVEGESAARAEPALEGRRRGDGRVTDTPVVALVATRGPRR